MLLCCDHVHRTTSIIYNKPFKEIQCLGLLKTIILFKMIFCELYVTTLSLSRKYQVYLLTTLYLQSKKCMINSYILYCKNNNNILIQNRYPILLNSIDYISSILINKKNSQINLLFLSHYYYNQKTILLY